MPWGPLPWTFAGPPKFSSFAASHTQNFASVSSLRARGFLLVSQGRTQIIIELIFKYQNSTNESIFRRTTQEEEEEVKQYHPTGESAGSSTTQWKMRKAAPPPKNEGRKAAPLLKGEEGSTGTSYERGTASSTSAAAPIQRRKGVTALAKGRGERQHHPQEVMLLCRPPLGGVAVRQVK